MVLSLPLPLPLLLHVPPCTVTVVIVITRITVITVVTRINRGGVLALIVIGNGIVVGGGVGIVDGGDESGGAVVDSNVARNGVVDGVLR